MVLYSMTIKNYQYKIQASQVHSKRKFVKINHHKIQGKINNYNTDTIATIDKDDDWLDVGINKEYWGINAKEEYYDC